MTGRLPARLEVSSLIRAVAAAGGFATVLRKGDPDGGTILLVLTERGGNQRLYERMPAPDGTRRWTKREHVDPAKPAETADYLARRGDQDPDLWIVELDIAAGERFIGLTDPAN